MITKTAGYADDDLMQIGRLAVWEGKKTFDVSKMRLREARRELEIYLFTQIKNKVIDYLRSQDLKGYRTHEKGRVRPAFVFSDVYDHEPLVDPHPDSHVYLHEIIDRCEDLSKKHQTVLYDTATGVTLAESAKRLGVTESRACQILREAREFIRD